MTPTAVTPSDPTAGAVVARSLIVSADALQLTEGADVRVAEFTAGDDVLALLRDLLGVETGVEDIPEPWTDGGVMGANHIWDDASLALIGDSATVLFSSATVGGVPVSTSAGLTVGSTRSDVLARGGFDVWDEDGDGVADHLGLAPSEVSGTQSLARDGEVGIVYVSVALDGDVVDRISAPANDFSDL